MKRFLSLFLSFVMLAMSFTLPITAQAGEYYDVEVSAKVSQKSIENALAQINDFRTGEEAWYWDQGMKTKVYPELKELTWDSNLEKAAMQRAVECAFWYDHTRPNGKDWYTVDPVHCAAENIASGYTTDITAVFKETNENYNNQGHRRNMLGNYRSVGMACVGVEWGDGGYLYFIVQEFGYTEGDGNYCDSYGDNEFTVNIERKQMKKSKYPIYILANGESIQVSGDYAPYKGELNLEFGTSKTFEIVPTLNSVRFNNINLPDYFSYRFEEEQDIVEYKDGILTAKKLGSTTVHATQCISDIYESFDLTINVVPADISNTDFDLEYDRVQCSADIPDSEYTPAVSNVVFHSQKGDVPLIEGIDYKVEYSYAYYGIGYQWQVEDYEEEDTVTVKVVGLGNYTGCATNDLTVYCKHNPIKVIKPIGNLDYCTETWRKCTICGREDLEKTNDRHYYIRTPIPYNEIKDYIRDMYNADATAQSEYTFEEYYDNYMNSIPYSEYELCKSVCKSCGYIFVDYETKLPSLSCDEYYCPKHNFVYTGNNDAVDATCVTDGKTESGVKTCTTCGYQVEVKSEVIPATNKHTLSNTSNPTICRVMLTPNTCDENGIIQFSKYYGGKWTDYNSEDFTCSVCGKCFNVELPSLEKTGHNIKTTTSHNGTLKIEYCDNKTNAITLTGEQLKAIYNDKNFFQFLFNSNNPVTISITFNNHGEDVDEIVSNLWCVDFDATTGTQIKSYKLNNGKICGSGGQEIINPQKNISYVTNDNYTTLTTDCNYIRSIYKYFDPTYYFDDNSSITVTYENCDYEEKTELDHYYELTNTVESTCKVAGYEEYTCVHCGDSYTEPLSLAEHTLINGNDRIEPTCENDGYTGSGVCTVCGKTIAKGDVIPALGHKYTSVIVPPTCSEQGYTLYTCERCGDTYKANYTDATGNHNVVIDKAVKATCSTDGLTEGSHCADCGKVIVEQKIIGKTSHTPATLEAVAPTCTTNGLTEGLYCSVCGEILKAQEKINKTSHIAEKVNAKKATSTEDGYTGDTVCSECKTVITKGSVIPKASNIKLSRTSITYTGSVQRPSVTVTDEKGNSLAYKKDFTVSYSNWNSKNVGEYTVTVNLIGNYSGTYTYSYYINPKPTTLSSVSGISNGFTVKWNKQNNQTTGYQIQYSTKSNFSNAATVYGGNANTTSKTITGRAANTKYYVRVRTYKNIGGKYFYSPWSASKSVVTLTANPKPTTLVSLTARSKGFTVKWNKQTNQTTGYQIQYSTRSDFKNAATVYGGNANTTSKTITGRASKTRYYVRVRTYRNVGGKYYYSSWSPSKSVVTLK